MIELQQSWPSPTQTKPIVIFGAGSIVADAHLPAYRKAGLEVRGIYDPDLEKADKLADAWGCAAFRTLDEAVNHVDVIFDLATPPAVHVEILEQLPWESAVLIQKPMGNDLSQASRIVEVCNERKLEAAVNFQLRFAPMSLALRSAIDQGLLGKVVDFDAWLALDTPWHLWKFLEGLPRVRNCLAFDSLSGFDQIHSG